MRIFSTKNLNFVHSLVILLGVAGALKLSNAVSQDLLLLTLGDDKIGEIQTPAENLSAQDLINTYYELLPMSKRIKLIKFAEQLDGLLVEYEVARTAADSAEITEVISDMDAAWFGIQTIHSEQFSDTVVGVLNKAYGEVYPLL